MKEVMKDCSDIKSFTTNDEAYKYIRGQSVNGLMVTTFHCYRCGRWHLAAGHDAAVKNRRAMQRERCLTDRDLHVQMARCCGVPLEELDRTMKLDLIGIAGPGIQVIELEFSRR